jgi:charged multivesicular body protein 4
MAGFMASLWGRKDAQQVSRDAIVGLRQQLQMIEKKEEYTQKKVEEELAKAKANAVTNKAGMFIQTFQVLSNRIASGLIV